MTTKCAKKKTTLSTTGGNITCWLKRNTTRFRINLVKKWKIFKMPELCNKK